MLMRTRLGHNQFSLTAWLQTLACHLQEGL